MESQHVAAFSRRPERNGIIVSTCDTCSAAVAASLQETELEKAERGHTCNPEMLDLWKLFIRELKRGEQVRHTGQWT
jgi:hypothetical protein